MTQSEELFDELGVAFAALGLSEVKELPHREVAGMRCHKVQKAGFHFGVAEGSKIDELGLSDAHISKAVDRCREFVLISDASQTTGFLWSGVDLEASAGFLRKTTRPVVVSR